MRALIANRFTVGVDARGEMILVGCGGVVRGKTRLRPEARNSLNMALRCI